MTTETATALKFMQLGAADGDEPVWVYPAHVAAVEQVRDYRGRVEEDLTFLTLAGSDDSLTVRGRPADVLAAIDAALRASVVVRGPQPRR